jgi:hypothetical protein
VHELRHRALARLSVSLARGGEDGADSAACPCRRSPGTSTLQWELAVAVDARCRHAFAP